MIYRLGMVIYWACSGLAVLVVLLALYGGTTVGGGYDLWTPVVGLLIASIIWLVGRGGRYILSGS